MSVKIKATSKLKLNDSPVYALASGFSFECNKFDIIVSTLILKKFILQVVSWGHGGCLELCIAACQVHKVSVCNNIALNITIIIIKIRSVIVCFLRYKLQLFLFEYWHQLYSCSHMQVTEKSRAH